MLLLTMSVQVVAVTVLLLLEATAVILVTDMAAEDQD